MRTLFISLAFASQLAWGALEFDSKLVQAKADAEAENVVVDFKFTNKGDKPVIITNHETNCDCLTVQFSGGTQLPDKTKRYNPGESGIVRGNFKVGNERGVIERTVVIWLDGTADEPSIELTARIDVPKIINMTPRSLKWDVGSEPKPQRIDVTMNHDQAVHIKKTSSSSPTFEIKLEPIEEGKHYVLWVHPKTTEVPGIAVIRVETDSNVKNQKIEQVFAMVQRPE